MNIMMKRLSLIFAVLMIAFASQAQLLWKVSGGGLSRPSYIVGTYHFAPSSMIDEIPGMAQALQDCDVVVGELEMENLMSQDVQLTMAQAMMAPADSTLDKLYSPEDYAIIENVFNKYFGSMGVKLNQMNSLKPSAISTQMQALQALKYFPNFDANDLIDLMVQKRGKDLGKPALALETLQEQTDILFNSPISDQAKGLLEACKKDELFVVQSSALVEAYMSQDLSKLEAIITNPELGGDDSQEMDALLYNRNRIWVAKLVGMMPERACLVCVGAGHLPGQQGLLQLLRDRGYTVDPMQ